MIRTAFPALIALAAFLAACGSGAPAPPLARTDAIDVEFVVDPLGGYPLVSSPDRRLAVREGYAELRRGAAPETVAASARALLEEDPGYHPASVLLAQSEYVAKEFLTAAERLRPIVDELPDYVAAALLRARALERAGKVVEAYAAYRDLADIQVPAAERAAALEERVIEIVHRRLRDDLRRGRVEDAQETLARLESWKPDAEATLEARLAVMRAAEDREGQLEVLRRLVSLSPAGPVPATPFPDAASPGGTGAPEHLHERALDLAELEIEIGDLRRGLQVLDVLEPERLDFGARDRFLSLRDRARFLRRLDLLPPEVTARAEKAELDRADLASLFYWLLPGVRYAPLDDPPIAGDIVDQPERTEILHVLDEGLMEVDESVHRFDPERPATRLEAFRGILAHLATMEPAPACLEGTGGAARDMQVRSRPWICASAARCGLIDDPASCLPSAPVAGAEALEIIRRGLDQLGGAESEKPGA